MKEHFDNKFFDDIDERISDNYFSPIMDYAIGQIQVNNVCDVGCGNGFFTGNIKKSFNCKSLIGIDSNKYALNQASELDFDELFQIGDFNSDRLPIDSNSMDLVICKDVLEHLINPIFLVNEINRILKPGGYLLLSVPNHFPLWGRIKFLLNNNIDTFHYFPDSDRYEFPHIRFYTLSSIKKLLSVSNFIIEENLSFFFINPPIIHKVMPVWLKKLVAKISTDNFSLGVVVLAKKV